MSIATKMCIQICAKLGGEPWIVKLPLKTLMVIGFDTYGKKFPQVTSMVASISSSYTKYFSTVSFSSTPGEKVNNICLEIGSKFRMSKDSINFIKTIKLLFILFYFLLECIQAYKSNNNAFPGWIIIYRDGLGDDNEAEAEVRLIEVR